MSVSLFNCLYCNNEFSDFENYVSCECGEKWCSMECAEMDGLNHEEKGTCPYCYTGYISDSELLDYILNINNWTKEYLIESFKNNKK